MNSAAVIAFWHCVVGSKGCLEKKQPSIPFDTEGVSL